MYRLKQFIFYLISLFVKIDEEFLDTYLTFEEKNFFNELLKSEKQHSIRVAKKSLEVMKNFDIDEFEEYIVVKMCLLHDVGKSYSKINLFLKPFMVLMLSNKKIRKIIFFISKERVYKYYRHSKYSFDILKTLNLPLEILYSIKYHHSCGKIDNKYIRILKYCDGIA